MRDQAQGGGHARGCVSVSLYPPRLSLYVLSVSLSPCLSTRDASPTHREAAELSEICMSGKERAVRNYLAEVRQLDEMETELVAVSLSVSLCP